MPRTIMLYVRWVDAFNRVVGRIVMFMIFVMIGVLLYASVARTAFNSPLIWSIEVSQFLMSSSYLLGGAYAMQMGAHVRMDLFYSRWSDRTRAWVDALTILLEERTDLAERVQMLFSDPYKSDWRDQR